ncbi:DNA (cytosine-5)-methyltransferase DRM2-like isoform X3 [Dioscorea cayenensis subsp. rotundata]|uniref:DNA (cytosine-5-)-methyltransferase n=1 Tax=Dioscorea cayennensis subsp. rotundata TaxID=55577 RepID=A0AB40CQC1_DIOCR|nr:DNA (cytosine-5)-methyltransferase DRM2-like isoform X3 [Dioscorea cayenensis subsp. rotundata]
MDWMTDSEEDERFEWDTSDEEEEMSKGNNQEGSSAPPISVSVPSQEFVEAGSSRSSLLLHFVGMGFSEDTVAKAIKDNGEGQPEVILETLLTYAAIEKSSLNSEQSPLDCSLEGEEDVLEDDDSDMSNFEDEGCTEKSSDKDMKLSMLVEMGFPLDEASSAIDRCGSTASVLELADSIHAAQLAAESVDIEGRNTSAPPRSSFINGSSIKKKRNLLENQRLNRPVHGHKIKKLCSRQSEVNDEGFSSLLKIPMPMIGFSVPNQKTQLAHRKLPEAAIGPPYFYYENVALTPKGVWDTMSRFLYDIEPEFVDSKYFCAANRKRGYIHNLPIQNRFPLLPLQPRTIKEALPMTEKWWPAWDPRTQLNCLQTSISSAKNTERIRSTLVKSGDPPPERVRQYVINECKKWNLVWVGLHKVAPLEPDEIEMLLGFPKNHTRGGGISRTDRYKSLGNSFQVDTVAYHLSVLKNMFPNGINVLSLFSGIGGAEVALHRLGIHLKNVVSVELSEINRNIIRAWWEQTDQTGNLIELPDVQQLNGDKLAQMINSFGGFDLVIGGSPCNNLAGSNRLSRIGLEGKQSSLFYDYFRILDLVKNIMGKNI